jgi:FixJ family two-component response regulator
LKNKPLISIIDNDKAVGEAAKGLVQAFGFDAATFSSGDGFLRSSRLASTSCLILDVHMPDMNGFELQRRLKDQGRNLPAIFITAFPDPSSRRRAKRAGAVSCLAKPFSARVHSGPFEPH